MISSSLIFEIDYDEQYIFRNSFRYMPSLLLSIQRLPVYTGLKSGVTRQNRAYGSAPEDLKLLCLE